MDYNMSGEDASLDDAVAKITAKLTAGNTEPPMRDARDERVTDGDPTEYDGSTDLEQLQAEEANAKAGDQPADKDDDTKGADENAAVEGEDFFELPGAAEGEDAVKIPRAEAIEAVRAYRQMNGELANVLNAKEAEYIKEQDAVLGDFIKAHDVVIERAEAALRIMPRPQMPSELLLDPNSQYYNPEQYHLQVINYNKQVDVLRQVQSERDKAQKEKIEAQTAIEQVQNAREHERLSRIWKDDWKDPAKREAKVKALTEGVQKHFGIDAELLAKLPFDHRIMQAIDFALKAKEAPVKAAEVRKHIQETVPKAVNGRAPPKRGADGQFVAGEYKQARKELAETGSEDAFVRALMAKGRRFG